MGGVRHLIEGMSSCIASAHRQKRTFQARDLWHERAAGSGGVQAVAGLADDVAAAVLGQGEVEDEVAFDVFASGDAFEHLDGDAAGEQVVEHEQSFEQLRPDGRQAQFDMRFNVKPPSNKLMPEQ